VERLEEVSGPRSSAPALALVLQPRACLAVARAVLDSALRRAAGLLVVASEAAALLLLPSSVAVPVLVPALVRLVVRLVAVAALRSLAVVAVWPIRPSIVQLSLLLCRPTTADSHRPPIPLLAPAIIHQSARAPGLERWQTS
jgi:hypothetical protein